MLSAEARSKEAAACNRELLEEGEWLGRATGWVLQQGREGAWRAGLAMWVSSGTMEGNTRALIACALGAPLAAGSWACRARCRRRSWCTWLRRTPGSWACTWSRPCTSCRRKTVQSRLHRRGRVGAAQEEQAVGGLPKLLHKTESPGQGLRCAACRSCPPGQRSQAHSQGRVVRLTGAGRRRLAEWRRGAQGRRPLDRRLRQKKAEGGRGVRMAW